MFAVKHQYNIEEYSFSQTTLEQIFLLFAKESGDDESCDSDMIRERDVST